MILDIGSQINLKNAQMNDFRLIDNDDHHVYGSSVLQFIYYFIFEIKTILRRSVVRKHKIIKRSLTSKQERIFQFHMIENLWLHK